MKTMFREHAFDSVTERRLFSISIASPTDLPRPLDLPAGNFVVFLAWDARGVTADDISAFVEPLLRSGASYFVCWGPDCERVHDIIDEIVLCPGNDFGVLEDSCIMTTWHGSEPLRDALWFFLVNSWPDEHYEKSSRVALAISVGSSAWAAEIEEALDGPREFIARGSVEGKRQRECHVSRCSQHQSLLAILYGHPPIWLSGLGRRAKRAGPKVFTPNIACRMRRRSASCDSRVSPRLAGSMRARR